MGVGVCDQVHMFLCVSVWVLEGGGGDVLFCCFFTFKDDAWASRGQSPEKIQGMKVQVAMIWCYSGI